MIQNKDSGLIRCFIALELPRGAIDYLEEVQKLVKKKNLFFGKFTEPENLHLTLKFLGEISEEKVLEITKKLEDVKINGFEASLSELGFFSEHSFKILWAKLNGKDIWDLQSKIDESLKDLFEKEERFMSHITLARIKKVVDKNIFLDYVKNMKIQPMKFKVNEFVLKKSELKPDGPVYSDIKRYNLL